MPFTLQNRKFLHSNFFLKVVWSRRHSTGPNIKVTLCIAQGADLGYMLWKWKQNTPHQNLFNACERSFKGKDEDGGRAEGDEKSPDEVHHNTQHGDLDSWRWLHWRIKFMLILHRVGRTRRRVRTCWWSPCGWGSSSRWVGRGGQRRARLESHWQVLHSPRVHQEDVKDTVFGDLEIPLCKQRWPRKEPSSRPVSAKIERGWKRSFKPGKRCRLLPWKGSSFLRILGRTNHRQRQRQRGRKPD